MQENIDLAECYRVKAETLEKRLKRVKILTTIAAAALSLAVGYIIFKNKPEEVPQESSDLEEIAAEKLIETIPLPNYPSAPKGYEYWKTLTVEASAYCPCTNCCGVNAIGQTADGSKVNLNDYIISRDENLIPKDCLVFVPGYTPEGKFARPLDKGSKIKGNKIDILFTVKKQYGSPHERAIHWGRKTLDITIYKPN